MEENACSIAENMMNGPGVSGVRSSFRDHYNVRNDNDDGDCHGNEGNEANEGDDDELEHILEAEKYHERRAALIEHYNVLHNRRSLQFGYR